MKRRSIFKFIRLILYVLLIIALVLIKFTDVINASCYIKENFGITCPSCGITRATKAILDLDFSLAVEYNAYYTFVLLPVFSIMLIDDVVCMIVKRRSFVDIILCAD